MLGSSETRGLLRLEEVLAEGSGLRRGKEKQHLLPPFCSYCRPCQDSRQPFQLQRAPEMRAGLCKTGTLLTHMPCRSTPLPTALVQAPRGSGQPREPSLLHGVKLLDGHRPRLGGSVPVLCVAVAWFGFSPCPYFTVHATNGAWMLRSPRGEADLGRDWASVSLWGMSAPLGAWACPALC